MAHCPAYSGPICSLCCSLESRCHDGCKPHARSRSRCSALARPGAARLRSRRGSIPRRPLSRRAAPVRRRDRHGAVARLSAGLARPRRDQAVLRSTLWTVFFLLSIIAGVAAWLFVLAQESRRVAEEENRRQTDLLMHEIEAHKRTDATLQKAKERPRPPTRPRPAMSSASATSCARRSTPSSAMRNCSNATRSIPRGARRRPGHPPQRRAPVRPDRRPARHLADRDGPLQLNRNEVRTRGLPRPARRHVPPAGDRQGHRLPLHPAEAPAGRRAHRREAAAADPDQPAVQRDQVHRRGHVACGWTTATRSPNSRSRIPASASAERPGAHLPALRARAQRHAPRRRPAPGWA